jgi:hypothetical protein
MEKTPEISEAIDASVVEAERLFAILDGCYQDFLTATMNPSEEEISLNDLALVNIFRHKLGNLCAGQVSVFIPIIKELRKRQEAFDDILIFSRRLQISLVLEAPSFISKAYRYLAEYYYLQNSREEFDPAKFNELVSKIWDLLGYAPYVSDSSSAKNPLGSLCVPPTKLR